MKMKVWMFCEAFALTPESRGGFNAIYDSLMPWSLPCESRKVALRELRNAVTERVLENYEGRDFQDGDDAAVQSDIDEVMANPEKLGRGKYEYRYSGNDREVVWRIYPCEVMQ